MAQKVVWSTESQQNLNSILEYWNERNNSNEYSAKLFDEFKKIVSLISFFPHSGKETDYPDIRIFIKNNFSIYYKEYDDYLSILHVWDNRRNPEDLKLQ